MTYYNTTRLEGEQLEKAETKAKSQEQIIFEYFEMKSIAAKSVTTKKLEDGYSPAQLWAILSDMGYKYPLTSVRRAISNLTIDGKLIKTEEKRIGLYGSPEYVWRVA